MSVKREERVKKILDAIEYGTLPFEETQKKVRRIVQSEIEKTDSAADTELIMACEDLLWEMETNGTMPFDSHRDENLLAVKSRLEQPPKSHVMTKSLRRITLIAAVMLVFTVLADGLFFRQWLIGGSTPDEQQYVIHGQVIDPQIISKSIAEHSGFEELRTTDWQEAVAFLGFEPLNTAKVLSEWNTSEHYISFLPDSINYYAYMQKTDDEKAHLVYNIQYYTDIENAHWTFEQNKEGETAHILGRNVYISANMDRASALWNTANSIYWISGNISLDEMDKIIKQIIGGTHE